MTITKLHCFCPNLLPTIFALALGILGARQAQGQVVTAPTDPVGFNTVQCLGNSDTFAAIPFTRPAEFSGTVQAVSGNVLTVDGNPAWTANQFVYAQGAQPKHYFALFGSSTVSNAKEGRLYSVTGNSANAVTLDLNGDDLGTLAAGTQVLLIPYWTLATAFPTTNANVTFTPTTTTRSLKTQILIPDYNGVGVNLAYSKTYYFLSSGSNVGWRLFGDSTQTDHGDDVFLPDGYFVVRHANGAPSLPFVQQGAVSTKKLTAPLATTTKSAQDNAVALIRPIDVALANTGLNPADGSLKATSSTRSIQDQILLYDNTQTGFNKSPTKTYYYISSGSNVGWRLFGDAPTTDHGADLLPAGSAFTIRKAASSTGQTVFWTNSPTY